MILPVDDFVICGLPVNGILAIRGLPDADESYESGLPSFVAGPKSDGDDKPLPFEFRCDENELKSWELEFEIITC